MVLSMIYDVFLSEVVCMHKDMSSTLDFMIPMSIHICTQWSCIHNFSSYNDEIHAKLQKCDLVK